MFQSLCFSILSFLKLRSAARPLLLASFKNRGIYVSALQIGFYVALFKGIKQLLFKGRLDSDGLYLKFDYVSNEIKLLLPYKSKILKKLAKQSI